MKASDEKRVQAELNLMLIERDKLEKSILDTNLLIESYNEAAEAVRATLQDIQSECEDKHSGKSDKWQESDSGELSQNHIDAIGTLIDSIFDVEPIDDIDSLSANDWRDSWEDVKQY